jgi:hypothetical protein
MILTMQRKLHWGQTFPGGRIFIQSLARHSTIKMFIQGLDTAFKKRRGSMKKLSLEGAVRVWAGVVILLSVALAVWVNEWWLLLTAFAGINLIQSAFTGFCVPEIILKKYGFEKGKDIPGS